ncbi:MAG: endonuclease/exonuclease/phosphatase family protein [Candidatus Eiseniibacteriota bacterium]
MHRALPALLLGGSLFFLPACSGGWRNLAEPAGPRYAGCCVAPPGAIDTLRVVTFNIKFAQEIDRAIRLFRDTPELRSPDIVFLQEMDERGVSKLARALALNYVYYPAAINLGKGRLFGNAVLARWPIENDRKILLPHGARLSGLRRIAVRATVNVNGQSLRLYSLHFATAFELGGDALRDQALAVLEDVQEDDEPAILAGDLNSLGLQKVLAEGGLACATGGLGPTTYLFSLDHIYLKGLERCPTAAAGVIAENYGASDHSPVWALVEMPRDFRSSAAP